jgi:Flp pilus assembly pilin Flp
MNYAAIAQFVATKLIPAVQAIMAELPSLLSTTEADVQNAVTAVTKIITDLGTDWAVLVAAVKAS